MLEIAVCDDRREGGTTLGMLREICAKIGKDCRISVYRSPEELLGGAQRVDIGVWDIAWSDENGIEFGRKLKERFPEADLIYIAGSAEYCRQVVNQVHVFSFLVRPVDREEFREQIAECMRKRPEQRRGGDLIFENVRNSRGEEADSVCLNAEDILYCEYVKSKREISIVLEGETYYYREVFDTLSKELEKYGFAVNCRGSIVNMRHIRRMKGYSLYLDNGTELMLAQKRVSEFKERMNSYLRKV